LDKYPETLTEEENGADMTGEKRDWVFARVTETIGNEYWLYCVDDSQLRKGKISAAIGNYDGLSGSVTFSGRLTINPKVVNDHIYIAFPFDQTPRISGRKAKPLPEFDREDVLKWMAPDPDFKTASLLESYRVPKCDLVLATIRIELSDVLFCFSPSHGRLWRMNFPGGGPSGGLAVAERPGEHCGAMENTTIYVLPDFDGDGYNELLVNSTATMLFDLSTHASGTLRRLRSQPYLPTRTLPGKK
jgi:hypothetical protein